MKIKWKNPLLTEREEPQKKDRIIERICDILIFSFKNKAENKAIEIAFNVEMSPTFVADVFSSAKN